MKNIQKALVVAFVFTLGALVAVSVNRISVKTADALASRQAVGQAAMMDRITQVNPKAPLKDFGGDFSAVLFSTAAKEGVPAVFVMGLIEMESEWHPEAVSGAGAIGLMQVIPTTAEPVAQKLGIRFVPPTPCPKKRHGAPECRVYSSLGTLGDSRQNIIIGTRILADTVRAYGPTPEAFRAYNRGNSRALAHWPKDRYAEMVSASIVRYAYLSAK
jgi:soluble lytic murein transglycosylase-like protein